MSLFKPPKLNKLPPKARDTVAKPAAPKAKSSGNSSSASSLDSDVEALRNGLAAENAKLERYVWVKSAQNNRC